MFLGCLKKHSLFDVITKLSSSTRLLQTSENQTKNVVRSVIPPIQIPTMFLDDYIWQNLDKWEHKTALQCAETGRSYLYSEVYSKSRALSNFLRNKIPWIKEKDTLAIMLPNFPEFPIIMLGIIQAGLRFTTINSNYKSDEILKQLINSEAKFVFTTNQLWPEVNQAVKNVKTDMSVAIIKHKQCESLPAGTINFNKMVEGDSEITYGSSRSIDDVIILPYSSGTSGLPKGVELTHRNIVSNLCQMSTPSFKIVRNSEGTFQEILPVLLPLFHIYGMSIVLLNGLISGSKLITIPKFQPEVFIDVLENHRPTTAFLVPATVLFLLSDALVPELIMQLTTIVSGAAPLGSLDITRLQEKSAGKTNVMQVYGLTETSPLTHSQTPLIENGIKTGGCGLALPNTECLITAVNTGESLGRNSSGELLIRGPQIMKGYYKNPEATNAAIDRNGWFKTGDIAYFDEHGHVFLTDRIKELIKVKGFQVAPAELEELLRNHPHIEDAAVIGVRHPKTGDAPKAFIVLKKNTTVNTCDVKNFVASKVAHYKQLTGGVVIVDNIPRTASGKILRRELRAL